MHRKGNETHSSLMRKKKKSYFGPHSLKLICELIMKYQTQGVKNGERVKLHRSPYNTPLSSYRVII